MEGKRGRRKFWLHYPRKKKKIVSIRKFLMFPLIMYKLHLRRSLSANESGAGIYNARLVHGN